MASAQLSNWEKTVLAEIEAAARDGEPCPTNLDLEMLIGCNSGSVVPTIVKRLEKRGFIRVKRYQRSRIVEIVESGDCTARRSNQHTNSAHVPRGMRSGGGAPTDRAGYRGSLRKG